MAPDIPPNESSSPDHSIEQCSINIDEESLRLLVSKDSTHKKQRYSSIDDTLSTSITSGTDVTDEEDENSDDVIPLSMNDSVCETSRLLFCPLLIVPCFTSRLKIIWSIYYDKLQQYPLIVKSITAFILMMFADLSAQGIEHLRGISTVPIVADSTMTDVDDDVTITTTTTLILGIDGLRTIRFGVFGLIGAPWTHYYYHWLDTILPPTINPWSITTFLKVCFDQGIQAPALLALIIVGLAFMEGRGIQGMMLDMKSQYVDTLIQNWKLWIPATIFNIAFVKPQLRVLYDNLIFFFWTIYLSIILNGD